MSLLNHICNIHEWKNEDGSVSRCEHPPLSEQQILFTNWLDKDSPAFKTLHAIVTNKMLLKDLKHMTQFKHTGKSYSVNGSTLDDNEFGDFWIFFIMLKLAVML